MSMARLYLLSHGFQTEYEIGFANGAGSHSEVQTILIGSDNTLVARLHPNVQYRNLRGAQTADRGKIEKALNLARYLVAYAALALSDRNAVFHFNGLFSSRKGPGVLLEALFARLFIKRWWLSVHNLLPHDAETPLNRWMFSLVYRLPDVLVVHTAKMAQRLAAEFDVPAHKLMVVEHGIDRFVEPHPQDKATVAQRFGLSHFDTLLLMFGNVSPYKGADVLLEALRQCDLGPNVLILIAGHSTASSLSDHIRQEIRSLKQSGRHVHWYDAYIPDDDVPKLLGAADAMLLPYKSIDQSGVIFAAKSAGLRVVASDVGSFSQYVDAPRDYLVPPGDTRALARALESVCQQPEDRTQRITAVEDAKGRYAWSVTLREYMNQVRAVQSAS